MEKHQKTKVKKLQKKKKMLDIPMKGKNIKLIQNIIIGELRARNRNNKNKIKERGSSEPSVNDLLKIILAQMIKEKKKPSYADYFAHKQPTFGFEYHNSQQNKDEITKNKEDISKIKYLVIHTLQNRNEAKYNDGEILEMIDKADQDPHKAYELVKVAPKLKGYLENAFKAGESKLLSELAEAKDQIEHITSERAKIFHDLEDMKSDYERIHKMAYELNVDNKNKNEENIRLNEMTEKLKNDLSVRQEELKKINVHIQIKQKAIKKNEKLINEYENKARYLSDKIEKHKNDENMTKEHLNKLVHELKEMENKIQESTAKNEELSRDNEELFNKVYEYKQKFKITMNNINRLENLAEKMHKTQGEGKKIIDEQKKQIEDISSSFKDVIRSLGKYEEIEKHVELMSKNDRKIYDDYKELESKYYNK